MAIALFAVPGCQRARRTYTTLAPAIRISDLVPPSAIPGIRQSLDVTLERDTRQALVAPDTGPVLARLLPGANGLRQLQLENLTEAMLAWGSVVIDRPIVIRGHKITQWPLPADLATTPAPVLTVGPGETPDPITMVMVYAAPDLARLDVETRPFVVPEGAVLRFGLGVRAPVVRSGGSAEARITVRDGPEERELFKATLPSTALGWQEERVALDGLAGRTIRLRFATRVDAPAFRGLAALFADPVVLAPRRTPAPLTNVVLISMDTLRARSLGVYGAARATSPTVDALARDGALFENAFSTAAFTLPGHMSMFTGLWLRTHGAVTLVTELDPVHRTLPELLRGAGYETAVESSASWITPHLGFRRSVDSYSEYDPPFAPPAQGLPCEAFTQGLEWLRAHRDEPFFLFVHNYQVHKPYMGPPEYVGLFGATPALGPVEGDYLQYRYEQEVRYADDQIRAFLEGLEALGLADRTLLILTADHGEAFGEHGYLEHTCDVHDEMAHVPLIMRFPGAIPAGRAIAEPVSLADIVPTVLDVLGLPPLPDADGTSLLPLLTGAAERLPRDGVFSEAQTGGIFEWFDLASIRSRTHSCIRNARAGTMECFDRRIDPWERFAPLAANDATADARAALERFVGTGPPLVPRWPPKDGGAVPAPVVEPERREQLRALGYIE